MKISTFLKVTVFTFLAVAFASFNSMAQSATISPSTGSSLSGLTQIFSVTTSGFGSSSNNRTYVYTISGPGTVSPASPATFTCTSGCTTQDHSFTFSLPGTYTVSVTVTQTQGGSAVASASATYTILSGNLWATANSGTTVSSFTVSNGTYYAGPATMFTPNTGSTGSTAALALSGPQAGVNSGDPATPYFYWLPNSNSNSGVVEVWGATFAGTNQTLIGTLDINGSSTSSLGFVRFGIGPDGVAYILAGDGSTVYLASFKPKGVTVNSSLPVADQLKIVDADGVTINGGTASEFQNGDLAITSDPTLGGIKIYALANVSSGATKIFNGKPNGNSTVFTKRWDLVDPLGAAFSGSVNGVAFDQLGSLYLSTATGIYFVDATTANATTGTVTTSLVWSGSGLQDLASNSFPAGSTLPVSFGELTVKKSGSNAILAWSTLSESNNDHFVVERSTDGVSFTAIGNVKGVGNSSSKSEYGYTDAITGTAKVIYYRLRQVDLDGKQTLSVVVSLSVGNARIKNYSVYPNPFVSNIKVQVESEQTETVTVRLVSVSGQAVMTQKTTLQKGNNVITISDLKSLSPGLYILEVHTSDGIQTRKINKQ